MKKLLIILILLGFGHKGWEMYRRQTLQPLHTEPYLVVYGRQTCGYTKSLVRDLNRSGIRYEFLNIDDPQVSDLLHRRMEDAGIETRRYNLPVVDLNNSISVRPDNNDVIERAKAISL